MHCGFNYLWPESNSLIRPVFPPLWWITCVLITKLKVVQYFENIWAKKNSKIIYQKICLVACWDNWSRWSAQKSIIPQLRNLYEKSRARGTNPILQAMLEIFEAEIKDLERIYLIIDGLKKCSPKLRALVEHELSRLCSRNLSVIVTPTECPDR